MLSCARGAMVTAALYVAPGKDSEAQAAVPVTELTVSLTATRSLALVRTLQVTDMTPGTGPAKGETYICGQPGSV